MSRKTILIKITAILLISINLVNNIHRHREEIRKKYILHVNQEFDKELQKQRLIFKKQFIIPKESIEQQIKQKVENKPLSRGGNIQEETFVLTFYTSLIEENSEAGPVTCSGSKLREGIVANNVLPQGTKIITNEFGELIVADKGGNNFDVKHRLDVFISRKKGENDYQYKKRVNAMGMIKVKGYIIN